MIRTTALSVFLSLLLSVSSGVTPPEENLAEFYKPRIVLLGESGVGKSSVALTLLGGYDGDDQNDYFRDHTNCFKVGKDSSQSITKEACQEQGNLFGNTSEPNITVIDTPGWGVSGEVQFDITEKIVDYLSEEIKYVNTFAILLKGSDNKETKQLENTVRLIKSILGKDFVQNVVLIATHWGHFPEDGNEEEKKNWLEAQKNRFEDQPGWEKLRAVYYAPLEKLSTPNSDEKVREELRKLVNYSDANEYFYCRDIKKAEDDISTMEKNLKESQNNLTETQEKLEKQEKELEEAKNKISMKDEIINNQQDIITDQEECKKNEIKLENCTTQLETCEQKIEERLKASTMTMVGVGLGSTVLGVILGFFIFRSFRQAADDLEEDEEVSEIIIDLEAEEEKEADPEERNSDVEKIIL